MATQNTNVKFTAVGTTDVGKVREHNEDNFLAVDLGAAKRGGSGEVLAGTIQAKGLSLVVCDGMGGAAAGEVASQMAVDTLHDAFKNADLGGTVRAEADVIGLLETAIHKANEAIFKKGAESKEHQGMGTTLTASMVLGDSLYLSQVGDSRGYILRKGKLVQMTRDQSLIGQLIEEGTLTEEQAEKLGGKNIILQALGVEETLKIDSKRYDILRGDILLLCSDGLTGMVPDALIEEILNGEPDLKVAGKKLIDAANANGGKDNITCILGRFEGDGLREPLAPLTDAEKTGGAFHAPPPPKSKAGRNAVIGTAAVLAVVAGVLLWPKPVKVHVKVSPAPATLKVRGHTEDAKKAFPDKDYPVEGDGSLTIELPRGLQLEASVEKQGYLPYPYPDPRILDTNTKYDTLDEIVATLNLIPAQSVDFVPPVYGKKPLSRVKAKFIAMAVQAPIEEAFDIRDDREHPEFPSSLPMGKRFAAGKWKAKVSRDGFVEGEQEFEVASDKVVVVELNPLTEAFGTISVTDGPQGAAVTIFDGDDPLSEKPAEILATRSTAPLKARATEVTVRVAKPGHVFTDQRVKVEEGKEAKVTLLGQKATLSWNGGENGARVTMARTDRPGAGGGAFSFNAAGATDSKQLDPGTYKVTYIPSGDRMNGELVLEPGQQASGVDIKSIVH
jgi:serine/threonine protein phosphatase PrpC